MNVRWFQEPEHVSYVEAQTFLPKFAKEVKLPELPDLVERFRADPAPEGLNVKTGMRGTTLKLFVPDLTFEERLEMGDTVWLYLGETHVCYCLYWGAGGMSGTADKPYWEGKHFSYFCNRDCEYFPCHEAPEGEQFNCLFCYCPLYALGRRCGGNFTYLDNGVKDCTHCLLPHKRENYGYITARFQEVVDAMKALEEKPEQGGDRAAP